MKIRKHYPSCYRVALTGSCGRERFGQIKRDGREWMATIRWRDSGEIVRHAGIWGTLREAVEELYNLTRPTLAYLFTHDDPTNPIHYYGTTLRDVRKKVVDARRAGKLRAVARYHNALRELLAKPKDFE